MRPAIGSGCRDHLPGSAINPTEFAPSARCAGAFEALRLLRVPDRRASPRAQAPAFQSGLNLLNASSPARALLLLLPAFLKQFLLLTKECCTHPLGRHSSRISPSGALVALPIRSSQRLAPNRTLEITAQGTCPGDPFVPGIVAIRASVPARPLQRTRHWGRAQVRRLWAKKSSSTRRRSRHV
jgi:hypothetical protein